MNIGYAVIGIGFWIIAVIIDSVGFLLALPAADSYTGMAILFGFIYLFLAVIIPNKFKNNF